MFLVHSVSFALGLPGILACVRSIEGKWGFSPGTHPGRGTPMQCLWETGLSLSSLECMDCLSGPLYTSTPRVTLIPAGKTIWIQGS